MGETGSAVGAPAESRGALRLLQLAAFFSSFDRFVVAPMLVTIAAALGASLAETTATASLYYLLYGGMQPVWGMLSDRLGRVRVIRLTLFGAALAGLLSAAAPNLLFLVAARALRGRDTGLPRLRWRHGQDRVPAGGPRGSYGGLGRGYGAGDGVRGTRRLPRRLAPGLRRPGPRRRRARRAAHQAARAGW